MDGSGLEMPTDSDFLQDAEHDVMDDVMEDASDHPIVPQQAIDEEFVQVLQGMISAPGSIHHKFKTALVAAYRSGSAVTSGISASYPHDNTTPGLHPYAIKQLVPAIVAHRCWHRARPAGLSLGL